LADNGRRYPLDVPGKLGWLARYLRRDERDCNVRQRKTQFVNEARNPAGNDRLLPGSSPLWDGSE
jgi:hypothetical protein